MRNPRMCNYLQPAIILVEPIMGENIGAAARAMKNFGLSDFSYQIPPPALHPPSYITHMDSMQTGSKVQRRSSELETLCEGPGVRVQRGGMRGG
jgi:hypothetical protein